MKSTLHTRLHNWINSLLMLTLKQDSYTITHSVVAMFYTLIQIIPSFLNFKNGAAIKLLSGDAASDAYILDISPVQITSNVNNLSSGNHSVIVTDNALCSVAANLTVIKSASLGANATTIKNVTCNGLAIGYAIV